MGTVSLAEAKLRLDALIDQLDVGETVTITRDGKAVARLSPVRDVRKAPVDAAALRALTATLPMQEEGAGSFMRRMREAERY